MLQELRGIQFLTDEYCPDYPLTMLRTLLYKFMRIKYVKAMVLVTNIVHLFTIIIQTYSLLAVFETSYLISYSPIYFATFYMLLASTTSTFMLDEVLDLLDFNRWDPKSFPKDFNHKIANYSQWFKIYNISVCLLLAVASVLFMVPTAHEKDVFYVYSIFENSYPELQPYLTVVYKATFPIMVYTMVLPIYQVIYGTCELYLQVKMACEVLARINSRFQKIDDYNIVHNKMYQEEVKNLLVFIVNRFNEILGANLKVLAQLQIYMPMYLVAGFLLGLSFLFFAFTWKPVMTTTEMSRLGIGSLGFLLVSGALVQAGQLIENMGEHFFNTVCDCNWYLWNESNKKTYLIILTNSKDVHGMKFSDNVCLNYELGVSMAKMFYSTVSVLRVIRKVQF